MAITIKKFDKKEFRIYRNVKPRELTEEEEKIVDRGGPQARDLLYETSPFTITPPEGEPEEEHYLFSVELAHVDQKTRQKCYAQVDPGSQVVWKGKQAMRVPKEATPEQQILLQSKIIEKAIVGLSDASSADGPIPASADGIQFIDEYSLPGIAAFVFALSIDGRLYGEPTEGE